MQGGELELGRTEYRGAYTGAFNFYLTNQNVPQVYPATARAVTDCRLFELPAAELGGPSGSGTRWPRTCSKGSRPRAWRAATPSSATSGSSRSAA